jgi:hypothetical protein
LQNPTNPKLKKLIAMDTLKKISYTFILVLASFCSHAQVNKTTSSTVNITNFTANAKENKLSINWSTDGTVPTNYFEVQKSDDGSTFKTVAVVLGPDPNQPGDSYEYAANMKGGAKKTMYFRLCHVSASGEQQVTKAIQL